MNYQRGVSIVAALIAIAIILFFWKALSRPPAASDNNPSFEIYSPKDGETYTQGQKFSIKYKSPQRLKDGTLISAWIDLGTSGFIGIGRATSTAENQFPTIEVSSQDNYCSIPLGPHRVSLYAGDYSHIGQVPFQGSSGVVNFVAAPTVDTSQYSVNQPYITSVDPYDKPTIVIQGGHFASSSVVYLNGTKLSDIPTIDLERNIIWINFPDLTYNQSPYTLQVRNGNLISNTFKFFFCPPGG